MWDLFIHALVAKENGHWLPFWILRDLLTFSGNPSLEADKTFLQKHACGGYREVEKLFLCLFHLLSYLRGGL